MLTENNPQTIKNPRKKITLKIINSIISQEIKPPTILPQIKTASEIKLVSGIKLNVILSQSDNKEVKRLPIPGYSKYIFSTHKIAATVFIPNPLNKPVVDHIDRNKTNNNIENLRWATYSENSQNRDNSNNSRKREVVQMDLDGQIIAIFPSVEDAKKSLGIKGISRCARGESEFSGGFRWQYLDDDDEDIYQIQEGEIFVPLIGDFGPKYNLYYPNYELSNFGTLINIKTGLKKKMIYNVYAIYALYHEGKDRALSAHKLVGLFFVEGRTEERKFINHKDENKLNPHYTNLEWVTIKENTIYYINRKKYRQVIAEINFRNKD